MKTFRCALIHKLLLGGLLFICSSLQAKDSYLLDLPTKSPNYLMAQNDGDDTYDPFSDYSEFDEASDEEADINFFKHGRFFTVGLVAGMRGFTESLGNLYSSGPTYGVFLSYFFDLRLALQFGFNTGDYAFELATPSSKYSGNVSLTFIQMNLKYYLNTQNVTRGLADLNPYVIGGFSQVYRTLTVQGANDSFAREIVTGVDLGMGIEIPLMRRKAYFGVQGAYHYVNFKDENTNFEINGTTTSARPKGDTFDILGILGMNF